MLGILCYRNTHFHIKGKNHSSDAHHIYPKCVDTLSWFVISLEIDKNCLTPESTKIRNH